MHLSPQSSPMTQVGLASGRSLGRDWRRRPGRPRARWTDQLRNDTGAVPADFWTQTGHPTGPWWSDTTARAGYDDSIYAIASYMLSPVRLSHGWISQKRLKLGPCNFRHRVDRKLHHEIPEGAGASNKRGVGNRYYTAPECHLSYGITVLPATRHK